MESTLRMCVCGGVDRGIVAYFPLVLVQIKVSLRKLIFKADSFPLRESVSKSFYTLSFSDLIVRHSKSYLRTFSLSISLDFCLPIRINLFPCISVSPYLHSC